MRFYTLECVVICLALCQSLDAAESPNDSAASGAATEQKKMTPEQVAAKKRLDYMFDSVKGYVGTRSSDGAKLTAFPKPLMRWTNPNLSVRDGLFVAWVDPNNRPMAAAQIYLMPGTEDRWYIEQQSLANEALSFTSDSNTSWSPRTAGITWRKFVGETSKPTKSKSLRLGQMRKLARQFRGGDDVVSKSNILRLLPSPMIRYDNADEGLIDGALFAFVNGTDPELLLQIEIREDTDSGKQEFWWAMSPMTTFELKGYLGEEEVYYKPGMKSNTANDIFHAHRLSGGVRFPL